MRTMKYLRFAFYVQDNLEDNNITQSLDLIHCFLLLVCEAECVCVRRKNRMKFYLFHVYVNTITPLVTFSRFSFIDKK